MKLQNYNSPPPDLPNFLPVGFVRIAPIMSSALPVFCPRERIRIQVNKQWLNSVNFTACEQLKLNCTLPARIEYLYSRLFSNTSDLKELYTYLTALSPLREKTWDRVQCLFTETTLLKDDYFITEGETAKQIGFLKSGIVRAFYRNNEGLEYNKHFFVSNTIIGGYSSLVTATPTKIIQQALTDCTLLVANYSDILKLYDTFPDFERVGRRLAELYFVEKEKREIDIVLLDADKRYLIFRKDYPQLEQFIPQYHIASYLGITPTQLSRIRRKFSKA